MANYRGLNAVASYERKDESTSEVFHENSKMKRIDGVSWGKRFEAIRANKHVVEAMSKTYKTYPNNESIELDRDFELTKQSFEEVLLTRRTIREYSGESITLKELSKILYFSYGITISFKAFESHGIFFHSQDYIQGVDAIDTLLVNGGYQGFRAPASAGGLYPLEIYPVIKKVDGIDPGIYHYNVREHKLEVLRKGDFSKELADLTFNQDWQNDAAVYFVVTALFDRTRFKYYERGYRFVLIDAGHMMENLYLVSNSLELGAAAIGGYYDDDMDKFLGIDGINEATVYLSLVGKLVKDSDVLKKSRLILNKEND